MQTLGSMPFIQVSKFQYILRPPPVDRPAPPTPYVVRTARPSDDALNPQTATGAASGSSSRPTTRGPRRAT